MILSWAIAGLALIIAAIACGAYFGLAFGKSEN